MSKVNYRVDYGALGLTDQKTVDKYNKEVADYLDKKVESVSPEAVAYFYLTLHKIENEMEYQPRGLSLWETNHIIRSLQGRVLTLIEASILDSEQRKALKDIINSYFSNSQSEAHDYDRGRYGEKSELNSLPCTHTASHPGMTCEQVDK